MPRDVDDGPRRGRPIDPAVGVALRSATLAVLAEYGWRGTTVERIAERAEVARTTIYRRYGSVHGVLIMLLDHVWAVGPVADTGSLRGDLVLTARASQELWADPGHLDYLCAMTAARRENGDVARALHESSEKHQAALRPIIDRARARGELQGGIDDDLLLDLVCSVMVRRALHTEIVSPPDFPERVVDAVLVGFAS